MKRFFFLALAIVLVLASKAQVNPSSLELPAYSPPQMNEKIIWHKRYTISFNKKYRIPNWVAWDLTYEHTLGNVSRDGTTFIPDMNIANSPIHSDYTDSGYTRGHMCPAGDNKWDSQAYNESFYMTNVCPQKYELNSCKWKSLEERCQTTWSKDYGKIYIVCGPIIPKNNKRYIRDTKILIPNLFFKAILRETNVNKKIHYEAIGYIMTQKDQHYMNKCIYTVNEIEVLTGLDLFHNLDDRIEEQVEDVVHENKWENPYI